MAVAGSTWYIRLFGFGKCQDDYIRFPTTGMKIRVSDLAAHYPRQIITINLHI
jgi:hypothetical protein